jgi:hypothetical protein
LRTIGSQKDNKRSGARIVTMATEGSGAHTGDGTVSRRVLTIRTIGWKTIAGSGGCDIGTVIIVWALRQRVCTIFLSSNVSEFEGEISHESDPLCHPPIDFLGLTVILQILVVHPDNYFV